MKEETRKKQERESLLDEDLHPHARFLIRKHLSRQLKCVIFGPTDYTSNCRDIRDSSWVKRMMYENSKKPKPKKHFYSEQIHGISLRPATTAESISIAAYDFKHLAKPEILDRDKELQLGWMLGTSEGVYVNPPIGRRGPIVDERILKLFLNRAKKVNGVWLYQRSDARDFGFAPYETFMRGVQSCSTFVKSGLARVMEHTEEKEARHLRAIFPRQIYREVNVLPRLSHNKDAGLRVLVIEGGYVTDTDKNGDIYVDYEGYAFGVPNKRTTS